MQLFIAPLRTIRADLRTKRRETGRDYLEMSPKVRQAMLVEGLVKEAA